jgi:hypothetical protein
MSSSRAHIGKAFTFNGSYVGTYKGSRIDGPQEATTTFLVFEDQFGDEITIRAASITGPGFRETTVQYDIFTVNELQVNKSYRDFRTGEDLGAFLEKKQVGTGGAMWMSYPIYKYIFENKHYDDSIVGKRIFQKISGSEGEGGAAAAAAATVAANHNNNNNLRRAIAASLSNVGGRAAGAGAAEASSAAPPAVWMCPVCYEPKADKTAFVPCGHITCTSCANHPTVTFCPLCRSPIAQKLRIFIGGKRKQTRRNTRKSRNSRSLRSRSRSRRS